MALRAERVESSPPTRITSAPPVTNCSAALTRAISFCSPRYWVTVIPGGGVTAPIATKATSR